VDEGLMRDAEYGMRRGRIAWGDGNARSRRPRTGSGARTTWRLAFDDAHHVVVIDVRRHETDKEYRNPDTLDAAYCDYENGRLDIR